MGAAPWDSPADAVWTLIAERPPVPRLNMPLCSHCICQDVVHSGRLHRLGTTNADTSLANDSSTNWHTHLSFCGSPALPIFLHVAPPPPKALMPPSDLPTPPPPARIRRPPPQHCPASHKAPQPHSPDCTDACSALRMKMRSSCLSRGRRGMHSVPAPEGRVRGGGGLKHPPPLELGFHSGKK